ncbi:MAG TPA: dienelactone hydrolase family protein [Alphaproteobacteria bacterium]
MGQTINLTAKDGFKLTAYEAKPAGKARGGLVMIQEIFGVNQHMRKTSDIYAAEGYHVVAPAMFDRVGKDIQLGYSEADIAKGREIRGKINWDQILADVAAAKDALRGSGKTGIIGYCFGGSVAWLGATRFNDFAASVCFYGGQIAQFAEEKPNCPVQMHFGETDHAIPLSDLGKIRAAQGAKVELQVYPAGHGFNCDERGSWHEPSAKLARERAVAFLRQHIG